MDNRAFVTWLTEQSPTPQLKAWGNGWIELPDGRRWNPGLSVKFNGQAPRPPFWRRLLNAVRGRRG
ncbi:hypothetical protein FEM41_02035 [Jejubacter calystegiae]|uniref:DUF2724 domain-containing protein n=1 Tax=Jejubacter calystegiae TaxID=2579935 RepID=A0A4P8YG77_9ENTR|nr:phage filamentation protein Fil family protein [Jejubacter calystegiae]QCT18504.1 hypothetical protein FEM41_02035 [Jejubacter calystegiae]